MVRSALRPALLAAALFAPALAHAGGYYYPDSGIVAFGRGGAWFASADSQFAQRYNPAGLVRVDRPTVNVGLSGVQQDVTFARKDADGTTQDPVSNEAKPFLVPQLGFAMPLPHDLAFAFGFYSPAAPGYAYDPNGAQRYTVIHTSIAQFSVGPSLAWRPLPWLAIGAGLQWNALTVAEQLDVTTSGNTDPGGDVLVDLKAQDWFTVSGNLGLLIEPVPELSIGFMVQPPSPYKGHGPATLDFTDWGAASVLDQTVWTDPNVDLTLSLPLRLGFGIAERPVDGLEIELAGTYERWSSLKSIQVQNIDITVTGAMGDTPVDSTIDLPAGFRDVYSVRLGGEYALNDDWSVRAGGFWENGARKSDLISVALYDPNKFQASCGASAMFFDHLRADLSFGWLFIQKMTVTDSQVTQTNAFGDTTTVVGNGDYSSHGWMVGGQLSWAFGKRKDGDG